MRRVSCIVERIQGIDSVLSPQRLISHKRNRSCICIVLSYYHVMLASNDTYKYEHF